MITRDFGDRRPVYGGRCIAFFGGWEVRSQLWCVFLQYCVGDLVIQPDRGAKACGPVVSPELCSIIPVATGTVLAGHAIMLIISAFRDHLIIGVFINVACLTQEEGAARNLLDSAR